MNKKLIFTILFFLYGTYCHGSDTAQIKNLISQAKALQNTNPDSSLLVARQVYSLSVKNNFKKGIGSAYLRIGSVFNIKGENDSAIYYIRLSKQIRKELKDYHGVISTCFIMYYIYNETGKIDSAYAVLFEALKYNSISNDSTDMAEIYIELGNLSLQYRDFKAALNYYQNAEQIAIRIKNNQILLLAYSGLGNYYFEIRNHHKALQYFENSDLLINRNEDLSSFAKNQNNIALCHDQLKNYKKASEHYSLALNSYIALGLKNDEALTCFNLASMYNNRNMPDSAIYYLNKSIIIANETKDRNRIAKCYEFLSDAYALKNDFKNAYKYHLISASLNDSLMNEEKISSIAEMQTKYETEKKEKQIEILHEQNETKRKQRNGLIAGSALLIGFLIAVMRQRSIISKEKKRSEELLLNILPAEVAEELKAKGEAEAKLLDEVTVLFTDFKSFTTLSEKLTPKELVKDLNENFTAFDNIIQKYGLEKIKTIGDAYMAAGGLPIPNKTHALDVVGAAQEINSFIEQGKAKKIAENLPYFEIRIGVHTGPVVAGIVGVKKFSYDIWGDTVNTANRLEASGEVGKVNISETTYELVKDHYNCVYRGKIKAKGKGEIDMYFVSSRIS